MDYDFALLDFDGLLVDTEKLHYRAYVKTVAFFQGHLPWSFEEFCLNAHISHEVLFSAIYAVSPQLTVSWDELYQEKKKRLYCELKESGVQLMPGAASLIETLLKRKIPSCVVTNSPKTFITEVVETLPVLKQITHWITREDYHESKPSPEGYLKALSLFSKNKDRVVGFEDTPKGILALLGTKAEPILISTVPYKELDELRKAGVKHYSSLSDFLVVQ